MCNLNMQLHNGTLFTMIQKRKSPNVKLSRKKKKGNQIDEAARKIITRETTEAQTGGRQKRDQECL